MVFGQQQNAQMWFKKQTGDIFYIRPKEMPFYCKNAKQEILLEIHAKIIQN